MWETWIRSLDWEDALEKGKATHSSILAWRIPWSVQSMRLQRVSNMTEQHSLTQPLSAFWVYSFAFLRKFIQKKNLMLTHGLVLWLLSTSIMVSRFVPIVDVSVVLVFIHFYCWIVFHCRAILHLFIHSPNDEHLDFFQFGAIINSTAMNIHIASICMDICFQYSWIDI